MINNKALSMVGLSTKAGRTVSGEFSVEAAVKKGKAVVVVVAADASDNTKKMFENMCTYYEVPFRVYGTKETLGMATGKGMRASLAIVDPGFGRTIIKLIDSETDDTVSRI